MGLVRKADGRYYVRVVAGGRQHWRSLGSRRRPRARELARAETALWQELERRGFRHPGAAAGGGKPTPVTSLIDDFTAGIRARRSQGHAVRLEGCLRLAAAHLGQESLGTWTAPAIQKLLDDGMAGKGWAEGRSDGGWEARTAIVYRQAIGQFLAWAVRRAEIARNPIEAVEKPRLEISLPVAPTEGQVEAALAAYRSHDDRRAARGHPRMIEFAARLVLGLGLRLGELCGLDWEDVDLKDGREGGRVLVRAATSKGRRDRVVPLTRTAREALESVQPERRRGRIVALTDGDARGALKACARAGISPGVGFQRLRQWYCSRLAMAKVPMPAVQGLAGHKDVTTTMRYYAAVTPQHVVDEIARLPW